MLEAAGFERCTGNGEKPCSAFVNLRELPGGRCRTHHVAHRRSERRRQRSRDESRFAPRGRRLAA